MLGCVICCLWNKPLAERLFLPSLLFNVGIQLPRRNHCCSNSACSLFSSLKMWVLSPQHLTLPKSSDFLQGSWQITVKWAPPCFLVVLFEYPSSKFQSVKLHFGFQIKKKKAPYGFSGMKQYCFLAKVTAWWCWELCVAAALPPPEAGYISATSGIFSSYAKFVRSER